MLRLYFHWQKIIQTAANLTSALLIHQIVVKLETILDNEAKLTHGQFAGQIESRIVTGMRKSRYEDVEQGMWTWRGEFSHLLQRGQVVLWNDIQVDWAATEFCYTPIIQSRSTSTGYDLRLTAESSIDPIAHKGVFLIAVGLRYKGYCANLGPGIVVDPSKVSTRPPLRVAT